MTKPSWHDKPGLNFDVNFPGSIKELGCDCLIVHAEESQR